MKKSQFFRAFVAGATISDGRTITPQMIDDVVATFNPETYSPRINIEHISGYSPEPPFNGYGTVTAVKAQDDSFTIDGKTETRRALYCQVDGNAQLVALAAANQKPFPSVELTPGYAGTDKVGLIGLAFTDTPASIGTQALKFSRSAPGTLFSHSPEAITIAFEPDAAPSVDNVGISATIAAAVAGAFSRLGFKAAEPEKPVTPPAPANDNAALYSAIGTAVAEGVAAATAPMAQQLGAMAAEFATIKGKLEQTEKPATTGFQRQVATGGDGQSIKTDC